MRMSERLAEIKSRINTADQAKAIDAAITVAFHNGLMRAAQIAAEWSHNDVRRVYPGDGILDAGAARTEIAAAIRAEIKS